MLVDNTEKKDFCEMYVINMRKERNTKNAPGNKQAYSVKRSLNIISGSLLLRDYCEKLVC